MRSDQRAVKTHRPGIDWRDCSGRDAVTREEIQVVRLVDAIRPVDAFTVLVADKRRHGDEQVGACVEHRAAGIAEADAALMSSAVAAGEPRDNTFGNAETFQPDQRHRRFLPCVAALRAPGRDFVSP